MAWSEAARAAALEARRASAAAKKMNSGRMVGSWDSSIAKPGLRNRLAASLKSFRKGGKVSPTFGGSVHVVARAAARSTAHRNAARASSGNKQWPKGSGFYDKPKGRK